MDKIIASSTRKKCYAVSFSVLLGLPLACGVFALLWSAVCDVLFIPGAFLVLVAVPFALVFAFYCAPVRQLFDSLNFSTQGFGKLLHNITGAQYPSDLQAWLSVALFYCAIAMIVAIGANAVLSAKAATARNSQPTRLKP